MVSEVQAAQAAAAKAAQVAAAWVWEEAEAEAKEEVVASSAHTRVVRAGSLGMVVTAVAVAWELAVAERATRLVGVAERESAAGGERGKGVAMASATEEASDPQKPAAAGAGAGGRAAASRRQSTRREGSWACYARWRREQRWPWQQSCAVWQRLAKALRCQRRHSAGRVPSAAARVRSPVDLPPNRRQ